MKNLCVFDIDCTLLPRGETLIPPKEIEAINALLGQGDVVCIDSGRPFTAVRHFLSLFGDGEKYAIVVNGGGLYDYEGHLLSLHSMDGEVLSYFRKKFSYDKRIGVYAYDVDSGLINYESSRWCEWELDLNKMKKERRLLDGEKVGEKIMKIMVCSEKEVSKDIVFTSVEKSRFHIVRSDPEYLEILPKGVDKGTEIETLRRRLRIDKSHVYTFGDAGNDLEMIENYNGVAMGESTPEILKAAKFITLPSKDDGVAYALKELLHLI